MPMNYAKTAMLLLALMAIFVAMGGLIGGGQGMVIAFCVALVTNLLSLWKSDVLVLRMFHAEEVDERSAPEYYGIVRDLARRAELPMPRVYVINNPQPNAFATGRSPTSSAVAASTGIFETLSREELAGVIAHELAHIKNRDTLTMTVAATIGGAISMLANYMMFFGGGDRDGRALGWVGTLAAILFAPMAAGLVQMAISRSREYQADRMGAMITGNPAWLASALAKIHAAAQRIPNEAAERVPAAAHLFIVNPLSGRGVDNWFSTHPNVENRISALEELAREMGQLSAGAGFDGLPGSASVEAQDRSEAGPWSSQSGARPRSGPWG